MSINLKGMASTAKFFFKKHGPNLMVWGGVAGLSLSGVWAAVRSVNYKERMQPHTEAIKTVRGREDATKSETMKAYAGAGLELMKLYSMPVTTGLISITSILMGHGVTCKRSAALMAAYAVVDQSYNAYRDRVKAELGEDVDALFRSGASEQTTETDSDQPSGQFIIDQDTAQKIFTGDNEYARVFGPGYCAGATENEDYNELFLRAKLTEVNNLLKAKGYMFLNEVYESLGFVPTKAGQVVGWVFDKNSDEHGDNCIKFRQRKVFVRDPDAQDGDEMMTAWLLDFNVDGPIFDHAIAKGLMTK